VTLARLAPALIGTPLGAALLRPAGFLEAPGARFVKDHRRTAVAAVTVEGREVFIKRFKPYVWYRRLEWLLAPTPARRCWEQSVALEAAGFHVPAALAATETRRGGLPADNYFVTTSLAGAEPAGRYWREKAALLGIRARRGVLAALARELRRFHDARFYTRDANADNFLVRTAPAGASEFFLLDLENVRRVRAVSGRRRVKNLVQLHRPVWGAVGLRDRLHFLRAYAGGPLRGRRDWLRRLAALDVKKEAEYRARRAR
jgi:hypothetical protein